MLKTVLKWGAIALLIFFVVTQPAEAASVVHSLGDWLVMAANGVSTFVSNVV